MSHADHEAWRAKQYAFFAHRECEYFPCHKTDHPEDFNCLFCYCPLYLLGDRCGGNFFYTEKGVKNCKNCLIPHQRGNYGYITRRLRELTALQRSEHINIRKWRNSTMEFNQVLTTRQSNRAFTDRQIDQEQLSALLNAAMAAPTAMARFERLHLTVVQDPAVLEELNKLFQSAVGDESAYPTYHAPTIICVSNSVEDEEILMGANVGCVMENMLLEATELGLGSVFLFGLFAATRALADQTKIPKLLKLPEGFRPVAAIAVGYPAQPLASRTIPDGKISVTTLA